MDKSQIQERTKELLEKAEKPKEFTRGLQELLESYVDKDATKNYQRIIPDTGKFFGVPLPILRVIAAEIGNFIQKEPTEARSLLETIWNEGSFEARQIAEFLTRWAKANPGKDARWIIKDGTKKLPKEKQTKILAILR